MKLSRNALLFSCLGAMMAGGLALAARGALVTTKSTTANVEAPGLSQSPRAATPTRRLNWLGHWLEEDKREDLVREVKTEFEFLNPDVEVNLKFPVEVVGKRSKQLTGQLIADMVRTGKITWDAVWMDTMIYREVAEALGDPDWGRKHLVDFSTVPGFVETAKPFIINDPFYRNRTGGILVGPHIEGYYLALLYNKDVAARMGLDIKRIGMTFEDLLGYVKTAHEYNEKNGTNIAIFYESKDWTTLGYVFEGLFRSEFSDFDKLNEERFTQKKQAALLKTLHAFEELGRYRPLDPGHDKSLWYETRAGILNDQNLFYANGTWMYSHWHGISPEKLGKMVPAALPVFHPVDHYLGSFITTFAVMKDSPNREDAIRLVMQWTTPKVAEKWVRYTMNPTGVQGHLTVAEVGQNAFEQFEASIIKRYGDRVRSSDDWGYILGKENRHLQGEIEEILRKLLLGEVNADAASEKLLKGIKLSP